MTGGPYREGGTGLACPACQVVLLTDGGWRLTCVKGCGDWWHKDGLERSIDWRVVEVAEPYRLFGYVAPELSCPDCARTMTTSLRAKILFAHCDDHGLWLPARAAPRSTSSVDGRSCSRCGSFGADGRARAQGARHRVPHRAGQRARRRRRVVHD